MVNVTFPVHIPQVTSLCPGDERGIHAHAFPARTGLFTPPGMRALAFWNNLLDFSPIVFSVNPNSLVPRTSVRLQRMLVRAFPSLISSSTDKQSLSVPPRDPFGAPVAGCMWPVAGS